MGSTSDRMDHEYFLELAALSEMGELSSGEYAELQRHLQECFSCRSEQAAFADILLNQLPLAHHEKHDCVPDVGTSQLSSWYRPVHFLAKPVPLYTHAVALLLILLGIVGYGRHEVARFRKVGVVSITKSSSQVGAEPGLLDYPVRKMSP